MGSVISVLIVVIILGSSIYRSIKKQEKNEWDKTTLPGRQSGQEIYFPNDTEYKPVTSTKIKTETKAKSRIITAPISTFIPPAPILIEAAELEEIPFLDTSNLDEIKKAIIYSEIFKRSEILN